eukprot:COSAG02_NODE_900_length_16073_cov_87.296607_2_plen_331_part_00
MVDTTVHDCGCAGIRAHGGNDTLLTPGNLSVLRNEIYDVAQWKRTYTPGIHWGGVSNTYSHNTVHKLPHNCFLGGGNEVKQVQPGGATYERPDGKDGWYNYPAVATANNSFEFNVLDGCGYECDDTGGFCKLPSRKGDITNYSNGSISNCVVQITELRRFAFALHADTCGQQGTAFVNVGNAVRHNTFRNIKAERAEGVSGSGSNSQAIYLDDIMRYVIIVLTLIHFGSSNCLTSKRAHYVATGRSITTPSQIATTALPSVVGSTSFMAIASSTSTRQSRVAFAARRTPTVRSVPQRHPLGCGRSTRSTATTQSTETAASRQTHHSPCNV